MSTHRFRDEWLVPLARNAFSVPADVIDSYRPGSNRFLAAALLRDGLVEPAALVVTVSQKFGCGFVQPNRADVDRALLALVPERICREHVVLPLRVEAADIHIATANPVDVRAEDEIRFATGRRPVLSYCPPDRLEDLIAGVLDPDQVIFDLLKHIEVSHPVELISTDLEADSGPVEGQAPIIRLVNSIIAQAFDLRASDIHIEHEERSSQVRFRIDGALRQNQILPRYLAAGPVVSRLKIMAKMDVAERRRPQDGQAKLRVGGVPITLRVSTLPTQFGEKVVARILDARNARASLADLGFRPELVARFQRQLAADHGFILVTGPTGSGKTTTLYAAIASLADGATNIVSIEDPIEYQLDGINQVQVNERQGLTFASVLKSVLRQDPDVIYVGEIRDGETADIACQAAMTGHLVLSTLHTNNAALAITRLGDMGVDRYKVLSSLRAVVAQRLVRKLCSCRRPVEANALPPAIREALRRHGLPAVGYEPAGCTACQFTGYSGRMLLTEFLEMTPALGEKIVSSQSAAEVGTAALEAGLLESIEKDALMRLSEGLIPVDEASTHLEQQRSESSIDVEVSNQPSPHVLVADGVASRRERICNLLAEAGFEAIAVADGASAVARAAVRPPDVMVCSLQLPVMPGLDLIKYVRGGLGLGSIPVIVLCDDTDDGAARGAAMAAGATDMLAARDIDGLFIPILRAARARRFEHSPVAAIMTPRLPADEDDRLAALRKTGLLDSKNEERFDAITRLAARSFNAPIALVSLVDAERQWFKAREGLAVSETPRSQSFCAHAIHRDEVMVVNDTALDPRFSENALVVGDPQIRFYAGCPLAAPGGKRLGTLCVIDRVPRVFTDEDKRALADLGRLVEREIAAG